MWSPQNKLGTPRELPVGVKMKTLMTHLMLISSAVIFSLLQTSCNKDDLVDAKTDAPGPNSPDIGMDTASNHHDFEIVEFDGFVNISAPISESYGVSLEGIVITESGIEIPVFKTSESALSDKLIQEGEQDGGGQPATRPESK